MCATLWDSVTIDIGTNPSEPTSECGLGNRENPSEPTTPLPSPQYKKSKSSKICGSFCWLKFYDFHISWPLMKTQKIEVNHISWPWSKIRKFKSIISRSPWWKIRKVKSTKGITYFTRLCFPVLRAREGRCGFRGILPIPTLTCGLGRICAYVDRPHCGTC